MSLDRIGAWRQQELAEEPAENNRILKAFWEQRVTLRNQDSIDALRGMLSKNYRASLEIFDEAISKGDLSLFLKLSNMPALLPSHAIRSIDGFENLGVISAGLLEIQSATKINTKDRQALQAYAEEKDISASIAISINGSIEKISAGKEKIALEAPFAIHSVGKVPTGVLALIMIEKGILSEDHLQSTLFDQLGESVKKILPPDVAEHLKKVTLHQAMTHRAGLGDHGSNADYLNGYYQAISDALEENESLPKIKKVEDFIPYAFPENEPFKPGEIGKKDYSNTGILLVGLVIQHAYEKYRLTHPKENLARLDFNGIMKKYVMNEAKLSNLSFGQPGFSPNKPANAKFNDKDKVDHHVVGSPAGGYWTTAENLAKFGQWLYQKCTTNEKFMVLVEEYGDEFYRNGVISHKGDVRTGSAYFSVSLRSGQVVSVLNAQRDNAAAEIGYALRKYIGLFSSKQKEERKTITDKDMANSAFGQASHTAKKLKK